MSEIGDITEIPSNLPEIKYSKDFDSPKTPYRVSIDTKGASDLLASAGVKSEDIPKIRIRVQAKQPLIAQIFGEIFGRYDQKTKELFLYTNAFWNLRQRSLSVYQKSAEEIQQNELPTDSSTNLFPGLVSGKRLSWYISKAPPDRAKKTIERLTDISINRNLNSMLAHESSHAADDSRKELTGGKQVRKTDLIRKFITSQGLALGISQGAVFLINNFDLIQNPSLHSGVCIGISIGAAAGASISSTIEFIQEGFTENSTEQKAYAFGEQEKGKHKIITIYPKQAT